jgi:hypothetical protein
MIVDDLLKNLCPCNIQVFLFVRHKSSSMHRLYLKIAAACSSEEVVLDPIFSARDDRSARVEAIHEKWTFNI